MVLTNTSTIHSEYNKHFREAATFPALQKYLQERNRWNPGIASTIEWDLFKTAVRSYKAGSTNHLTKLVYNQLATPANKTKAGGQHWQDPTCPHCQQSPETFEHLLRCRSPLYKAQDPESIPTLPSTNDRSVAGPTIHARRHLESNPKRTI